tara:strand:- start:63 stop:644 length:582 start_codon:yes stop_codon:yes gene_type:complete
MKAINTLSQENELNREKMDRKETILQIVQDNPGIRFNEIMRISNIRNGTLSHYVKKLEDEASIELERTPRVTRLYPAGIGSQEAKICKYLTIESQKKLIMFLLEKKTATSVEIREFLKKSPSVVSVNLNELFREKIIEKKYDIPSNKFSLKNPEEIRGIMNEYYPILIDKLTGNITEMFDFDQNKMQNYNQEK